MPKCARQVLKDAQHAQRGFTLLEAMVVVAILAILASVALPSYARWLDQLRAASARDSLEASVYFARGEAIRTGGNAVISPLAACAPKWSCGWSVVSPAGTVRQVALDSGLTITLTGAVTTYTVGARGTMQVARFDIGTTRICRQLTIAIGGRMQKGGSEGACT